MHTRGIARPQSRRPHRTDRLRVESLSDRTVPSVASAAVFNSPPTAAADVYSTLEDKTLTVPAAAGLLANDSDADSDSLAASLQSGPSRGSVTMNPDGSFQYVPKANFFGSDSFTYRVSDGRGGIATGSVAITIVPVNDPPTFTLKGDPPVVNEDAGPHSVVGFATGISTGPGPGPGGGKSPQQTVTFVVVGNSNPGLFTAGPAISRNGTLTYTTNPNANGNATITVILTDDGGTANGGQDKSAPQSFTIRVLPVNDPPISMPDFYSTPANTPLAVFAGKGVLTNDGDVDGDPLTAKLVGGPANKSVTLLPNGSFTYTPKPGFVGTDTFIYRAVDPNSVGSPATKVTIAVGLNSSPPVASDDSYSLSEDTVLNGASVLSNDGDPDGSALTATLVSGPKYGTLSLNSDGTFTYAPVADYYGSDYFTYRAFDGQMYSATATVKLSLAPVNDAPTITPIADQTIAEDSSTGPLAFAVQDLETAAKALVVTVSSDNPVLLPSGSFVLSKGGANRQLTVNPAPNANGTATITITVSDGKASSSTQFRLTVTAVNDKPVGRTDKYEAEPTDDLIVPVDGVLVNDTDADGDVMTTSVVSGPAHGTVSVNADGSFIYTPAAGFVGDDAFTYQLSDGQVTSAPVTVTIAVHAAATVGDPGTDDEPPAPVSPPGLIVPGPVVIGTEPLPIFGITDHGHTGTTGEPGPVGISVPAEVFGTSHGHGMGDYGATSLPAVAPAMSAGPAASFPSPISTPPPVPSVLTLPVVPTPEYPAAIPQPPVTEVEVIVPPPPALKSDNPVFTGLNELTTDIARDRRLQGVTGTVAATGVVATAGYVLLSPRLAYWFLSALLARRTVLKPFDPLDVVYAWERLKDREAAGDADNDSLAGMVK